MIKKFKENTVNIKEIPSSWEKLEHLPKIPKVTPTRPLMLLRLLIRALSAPALVETHFSYTDLRGKYKGKGPYFILMNHSSFLDLKMASKILFPHPYAIVSTADAFVGKSLLMRLIGCVQTQKFTTDASLVLTLIRLIKKQKRSVLMYPEAGYSLDGLATKLPQKLGALLKRLEVPVLLIQSDAASFLRDPVYNQLQNRKVRAKATVSCLFTPEDLKEKSVEELDKALADAFSFDHFAAAKKEGIKIRESFRADGLHRILYRCPHCQNEGVMKGEGTTLSCTACGASYFLSEDNATLTRENGESAFADVASWRDWQNALTKKEALAPDYSVTIPVTVRALCDHKGLYLLGKGTLRHDKTGLTLFSDTGKEIFHQGRYTTHTINVDFYFYAIDDVIALGNKDRLFYCFPENTFPVYKLRTAAEALYEEE